MPFKCMRAIFVALVLAMGSGFVLPTSAQAQVELNLRDADLRSFVEIVSEATGRSFVLDPQVRGTVTVLAPNGLSANALYEVFLNVLELNRLTVVEGGETDRIVPMNVARELASGDGTITVGGGYETRVIEVNNVPLEEITDVVRPLLPSEAILTPVPGANLLILSDRGRNHRRIEKLVKKLDSPRETPIELIRLRNANASEVLQVVQSMNIVPQGASVSVDRRSNAIIVSGSNELRQQVRTLATRLDTRTDNTATHVEGLKYAEAASLSDVVLRSFAAQSDGTGQGTIRIVPEPQTNSLLISAPQERMPDIISMIRYLDRRPVQVLVEAVIFEMSVQGFADLSVQFGAVLNNAVVGGVQFAMEGRTSLTSLVSAALNNETVNVGEGGGIGGGDYNESTGNGFFGFLTAITSSQSTRLLSTPSIMTLNNQEAEIVVAKNVPFVTGSYTSTGSGSNPEDPFQTIERQDVGLTLNVTPQINKDRTVRLLIKQEVSNLTDDESASGGEITARRAISTTVLVQDGNVIMLGGLLEDGSSGISKGVPGLSTAPVIGGLFRGKNAKQNQSVLLVMLRPRVISNDAEARRVSQAVADQSREASLAIQPMDSGQYPQTPGGAFPFDGADLNQPFDAGFVDNVAQSRNLPPLPTRLQFNR